jgi:hypothetical protein
MPKKVELYNEERQNIINKLFEILELSDTNKTFSLQKLDEDIEKQKQILDLEPDIKKFFKCSHWTCIKRKNVDRRWLSIIKYILKDMNIEFNGLSNKKIGTIYNVAI